MKKVTIKDLETGHEVKYEVDNYAFFTEKDMRICSDIDCSVAILNRIIGNAESSIQNATIKKEPGKLVDISDYLKRKEEKEDSEFFVGITLHMKEKSSVAIFCFISKMEMASQGGAAFSLFKKVIENGIRKGERFMNVTTEETLDKKNLLGLSFDGLAKLAVYEFSKDSLGHFLETVVDEISNQGYFLKASGVQEVMRKMETFATKKNLHSI